MPHFQYSGRYWRFAGDEIFVPGFIATFWRTVWTCIMLLILFSTLHRLSTCSDGWFLLTYLGFSVFSCILSILCEVLLVNVSLKGTLIESEARSGVGFYLTAHGILGCLQFCLSMCGFVIVFAHSQIPCSTSFQDNVDTALLSFVVISQLIDVITQLCCCYIFSAQKIEEELEPDDGESDEESVTLHQIELDMENNEEERDSLKLEELEEGGSTNSNTLSKKQNRKLRRTRRRGDSTITLSEEISVWESRCKSICKGLQMVSCNAFGGANLHVAEDFEAVAKVLTHFFQHDGFLDVVPSDVAAGILLVRIQQRYETITNDALKVMTLTTTNVNAHPDYGTMRIDEGSNNVNAVNSLDTENICVRSAVLVGNSISTTIKQTINIGNDKKNEEISSVHSDNDRGSSNMQSYGDKDVESGLNNGNSVYSRKDKKYNGYPVATLQDPESEMQQNLISNIHTSHFKKNRIIGRRILSKYNSTDRMLLSDAYHFSIYALAMYSQLIMLYMHPFSGPCRLCGCCNPIVCRCMRGDVQSSSNSHTQPHIIGDNSCKTHRSAIEEILRLNNKLHHTDIYYLSMINTNVAKPYAIFIDHETQSVVVSIRGTLSLEDCITDAMAVPTEMRIVGDKWGFDGRGKYAHGGILRSADHIRCEIEHKMLLDQIYGDSSDGSSGSCIHNGHSMHTPLFPTEMKPRQYGNYRLIITGHSLGAATATLLAMMLKPKYDNLKCITFGTPGSVVDATTTEELKSYVTSICLGSDIVCRLSVSALANLRENVLDCIVRAKVNKFTISQTIFKEMTAGELMYAKGTEPDSLFKTNVEIYKAHMQEQLRKEVAHVTLHIPGHIVHLTRTHMKNPAIYKSSSMNNSNTNTNESDMEQHADSNSSNDNVPSFMDRNCKQMKCVCHCCAKSTIPIFTPIEAHSSDMEVIYVSPTMVWDHLPDKYVDELGRLHRSMNQSNTMSSYQHAMDRSNTTDRKDGADVHREGGVSVSTA